MLKPKNKLKLRELLKKDLSKFAKLLDLTDRLNNISTYYENSDSPIVWELENSKVITVRRLLNELPEGAKQALLCMEMSERAEVNLKRYFSEIIKFNSDGNTDGIRAKLSEGSDELISSPCITH